MADAARSAEASEDADSAAARDGALRIEQIVSRHGDSVWRTARDLGVCERDLEDVVQEVLVVCTRRLSDIEPQRERAFLLATTTRVVANWRRGRRRRPADLVDPVDFIDDLGPADPAMRPAPSGPADMLERKRDLLLLEAALAAMTEPQRVAFTLFEIEGLTAKEIADELGVTDAVVFARVQRARSAFHEFVSRARGTAPGQRRGRGT